MRREELVIPILDPLRGEEARAGILLPRNDRAFLMQPGVAAGMIEMPMRADELRHRLGPEQFQRGCDLRPRHGDPRIDQQFALGPAQHGHVAA